MDWTKLIFNNPRRGSAWKHFLEVRGLSLLIGDPYELFEIVTILVGEFDDILAQCLLLKAFFNQVQ